MLVRIIGMALAFGAAALAGIYCGNVDGYRVKDLADMKKALAILKSEIEFAHTPLPEALVSIGERMGGPVGGMFLMLSQRLGKARGTDAATLWEECVRHFAPQTYFNKEDTAQVIAFGRVLGYLDKGMQMANIAITADYITEKMAQINETRLKNKRMFQSLGVLGGLLVVIIFL